MKPSIKILFDAHSMIGQKTGVGNYTKGLIDNLSKNYPDAQLIGYYHNFLFRKRITGLPRARNIKYRRIAFIPGQVVNALRRFGIDVPVELLTFCKADFIFYPNFWGQPSIFKTPNAPVIHDLSYLDVPQYVSDKNARDLARFVPRAISRSSFVVTVSEFSKKRIIDEYEVPSRKIIVTPIPPPMPLKLLETESTKVIRDLGITEPFLLFMGTLEPRKNLINLLEAYDMLPRAISEKYSLVLAGKIDWKYEKTLERLKSLQEKGANINYIGYVDDKTKAALYTKASLFILPSLYEGFGMPILEAVSYGTPVAISDIPPFHEAAGKIANYFDPARPKSIAEAIEKSLRPSAPIDLKAYLESYPTWKQVSHEVFEEISKSVGLRRGQ